MTVTFWCYFGNGCPVSIVSTEKEKKLKSSQDYFEQIYSILVALVENNLYLEGDF